MYMIKIIFDFIRYQLLNKTNTLKINFSIDNFNI